MRTCLAILLVIFSLFARGQTYTQLSDRAFDLDSKNVHDSAIFYYQQCLSYFPDSAAGMISRRIANCYLENEDFAKAEEYLIRCLQSDSTPINHFSKSVAARQLADLYLDQKRYGEALEYLELSVTRYRGPRLCEGGFWYENRKRFHYKKALCYYGMGRKKEAINVLAPWMFLPDQFGCELDYINEFFVNTVFEVYDKNTVRSVLDSVFDKLEYKVTYEKWRDEYTISADVYLSFFEATIPLNFSAMSVKSNSEVPEDFTREYFVSQVKQSHAYKYLMAPQSSTIY